MKKAVVAIAISALAIVTLKAQDQDFTKGPFIGADAGAIFQQVGSLYESGEPQQRTTFSPGARADLDFGYNCCKSFSPELEAGFSWNSLDKINGMSISDKEDINIFSIPILANFVFRVPTHCGLVPYVGVGGGANISMFELTSGGQRYHDSDIEPAAQGEAGLKYMLSPNASIGVAYKFMATFNQHYFLNQYGLNDHVTLGGIYIHGIFATFSLNF